MHCCPGRPQGRRSASAASGQMKPLRRPFQPYCGATCRTSLRHSTEASCYQPLMAGLRSTPCHSTSTFHATRSPFRSLDTTAPRCAQWIVRFRKRRSRRRRKSVMRISSDCSSGSAFSAALCCRLGPGRSAPIEIRLGTSRDLGHSGQRMTSLAWQTSCFGNRVKHRCDTPGRQCHRVLTAGAIWTEARLRLCGSRFDEGDSRREL